MIVSLLARAALWRAALACAALLFASSARAAQAPQPIDHSLITVNARRVEYFSNRAIISARGDVRISAPDGLVVTGDAFAMDLRLERFVVVGHVVLQTPAGRIAGAGLADFLPFRRIYFVPLEPSADRWTFLNGDFAHPEKGRIMPGDVFFLPDLSEERPFVIARRVDIDASSYARYGALRFVLLGGSIQTPPLPSDARTTSARTRISGSTVCPARLSTLHTISPAQRIHLTPSTSGTIRSSARTERSSIIRCSTQQITSSLA